MGDGRSYGAALKVTLNFNSRPIADRLSPIASGRYRQVRRQQRLVVDLDQQRVVARLGKRQVLDFVDEIDPVQGTLGIEGAFDQRTRIGGVESHRDAQLVRAGGAVGEREEPDHERVRDRELPGLDVREDAEHGVLAGAGVDMDAVAGEPREQLRFGMHGPQQARRPGAAQLIFLGLPRASRLRGAVVLAQLAADTGGFDPSAWPPWLQVLAGTFAAGLFIWLLIKLLKLALWLLFFAVVLGGSAWALWLLLQ